MDDPITIATLIGILVVYLLERLLVPSVALPWSRPVVAHLVHGGVVALMVGMLTVMVQRPYFALLIFLALIVLVVMVSNAKYHSLREPFIFQDFEYFTDAIKHPRLYIPFLGWWRALVAFLAGLGAVAAGILLEPSLPARIGWTEFLQDVLILAGIGGCLAACAGRRIAAMSYNPEHDLDSVGLLSCLWAYARDEYFAQRVLATALPELSVSGSVPPTDLVVVQSESFFDARRTFPGIRAELYSDYDLLKAEAFEHGCLAVPAWGANTVRSEFAFLSGLAAKDLGVHRFNPYRKLAKAKVVTLASRLRDAGYRTICVHPDPASFYERNRVYPEMGFDEFFDISAFRSAQSFGPYISDVAVAEFVSGLISGREDDRPLFIFVITMENHGPLHLEKLGAGDEDRIYTEPPESGCDELTIYLRHAANASKMFGMIREALVASSRASLFCVYGDHVPIMPGVYQRLGMPDGRTDFFLWGSRHCGQAKVEVDRQVDELAPVLIRYLG